MYLPKLPNAKCNLYSTLDIMEKMLQKNQTFSVQCSRKRIQSSVYLTYYSAGHPMKKYLPMYTNAVYNILHIYLVVGTY